MTSKWIGFFITIISVCFIFNAIAQAEAIKKPENGSSASVIEKQPQQKEDKATPKIEERYKDVKGGWRFLKWGMSIDETDYLLKIYTMEKMHFEETQPSDETSILYDFARDVKSVHIAKGFSGNDRFFFFKGKLIAVFISLGPHLNVDIPFVVKTLKGKFPKGKIYGRLKEDQKFKYVSKDLVVFTIFQYGECGVWYVDPKGIKNIQSTKTDEEKKKLKDDEDELRRKF